MYITGQIGNWHEGLVIKFNAEGLHWLDNHNTNRCITISVNKERKIIVTPKSEGLKVSRHNPYCYCEYYTHAVKYDLINLNLPRFELMKVNFINNEFNLLTNIPEDYLLPWPRLKTCNIYNSYELLLLDLEKRLKSAIQIYKGDYIAARKAMIPMPECIRNKIKHSDWAYILKRLIN